MSLKAVHLVFVNALMALALGCVVWKAREYFSPEGRPLDLVMASAALIAAGVVAWYGRYFLRKLKSFGYL